MRRSINEFLTPCEHRILLGTNKGRARCELVDRNTGTTTAITPIHCARCQKLGSVSLEYVAAFSVSMISVQLGKAAVGFFGLEDFDLIKALVEKWVELRGDRNKLVKQLGELRRVNVLTREMGRDLASVILKGYDEQP